MDFSTRTPPGNIFNNAGHNPTARARCQMTATYYFPTAGPNLYIQHKMDGDNTQCFVMEATADGVQSSSVANSAWSTFHYTNA